jgi:glycosyltransferase involved in cell wall biosynthesis
MQNPAVSFVVPCYKLGHHLSECINSILSQSYRDIEVLIMDDCSPDNTAEVANSFQDSRLRYVRNETNLGPLRNYNKGISLTRGRYVWLISADDYLRQSYILHRYVELMETHSEVGYTFCPAVGVRDGTETGVLEYSRYSARDEIIDGRIFLRKLLDYNLVVAASALARRQCYEQNSVFPLGIMWAGMPIDMVWGGDWYLWLLFALSYDVGYFAEPMVCYREHELSMTTVITQDRIESCWAAEMAVLWMIRQKAAEFGSQKASRTCLRAIANNYALHRVSKDYYWLDRSSQSSINAQQFEESLCQSTDSDNERNWIRARTFERIADLLRTEGDLTGAKKFYLAAIRKDPLIAKVYVKILLLCLGTPGDRLRQLIRSCYGKILLLWLGKPGDRLRQLIRSYAK